MKEYQIYLPDSRKSAWNFTLFALLINIFLFSWLLSSTPKSFFLWLGMLMSVSYFIFHLLTRRGLLKKFQAVFSLVMIVFVWLVLEEWLPAMLNALLISAISYLKKSIKMSINEKGIFIFSFPLKSYQWNEFSNVMLKDGILTLDLKNNKLVQLLTLEDYIDEADFNEFCQKRISST